MNKSLILALLATTCLASAQAATWYVATNGNDSNSCSSLSSPCSSINGAYQKAAGGDVVLMSAGTYGAQTLQSKSPTATITVRPADGATVAAGQLTVNGAKYIEIQNIQINGFNVNMTTSAAQYVTLRNVTNTGGLFYLGGNDISVIGGSIGPGVDYHPQIAPANGWSGQGNNFVFDGVRFHDWTRTSTAVHTECLQVAGTTNMVIRNSVFTNCAVFDLSFTSYNGAGSVTNLLLENNYFDTAVSGGYFSVHFSAMAGGTVRFNSATQGMFVDTTAPNSGTLNIVGNNIVGGLLDGNSGGCLGSSMAGSYSYNITQGVKCGSTDLNVAPGFANAGTLDLSLTAGVKAIDFVPLTVAGPSTDINGNPRPYGAGRDAGAFEYGSSASTATNPPPSLRAVVN